MLREVKNVFTGSATERGRVRLGRWISLLPILALIPRLGLIVIAADRQTVAADTRAALLWISSGSLAALVGCAEVYVGVAVVSRRHGGLALHGSIDERNIELGPLCQNHCSLDHIL